MTKLRDRQEAFCQHYVVNKNGSDAAIKAGYAPKTARITASKLLTNANIKARIIELTAETIKETKIDANWVLTGAKQVFDRCMQNEPVLNAKGEPAMVKTKSGEVAAAYRFDSAGANKALEIVGKHIDVRAFIERSENVNIEMTHDQWIEELDKDNS